MNTILVSDNSKRKHYSDDYLIDFNDNAMKPTCYTNTNTYKYNFVNMWVPSYH